MYVVLFICSMSYGKNVKVLFKWNFIFPPFIKGQWAYVSRDHSASTVLPLLKHIPFAFPKEEWGEGEDKKFHFQYFPACPQILTLKNISYSSTRCCDQIQGSMRSEKEIALHLTTADLDPLLSHLHEAHGMEEIGQRMGFLIFIVVLK